MIQIATEPLGAVVLLGQQPHRESLQSETSDAEMPALSGAASRGSVARITMPCAQTVRVFVPSEYGGAQMPRWITVEPLQIDFDNSPYERYFPDSPGCYVIYVDDRIVYVGQTTSLLKRLRSYKFNYAHYSGVVKTPWGNCERIRVKYRIPKRYGEWAMTELRLIKRLQPIYNCIGSVRKRGQP